MTSDSAPLPPLCMFVDVDDTPVRSVGGKRIVNGALVERVRRLRADGAVIYLWSTGGADYARGTAAELGIADCFAGFLPKPQVMIDDQDVAEWRRLVRVHPANCPAHTADDYRRPAFGE